MGKKFLLICWGGLLLFCLSLYILEIFFAVKSATEVTCKQPLPPNISAGEAILVDGKTQEIFYEKNCRKKAYPASTTKIMTALVALEICEENNINLKEKIVVPKEATLVEGSSLYLKAGQQITLERLLYGTMLRSGNDGATTLAIILGGNLKNFVNRMNNKAFSLGCKMTHFENPTGLYDDNHYTTAKDLSRIASAAMENKMFRKIVGTKVWKNYTNKNKTIFQYRDATGIKIGFTKNSGRTLVASAKNKSQEFICVVLSDGNWFNDAYALMDYGFAIKEVSSKDKAN